MKSLLYTVLTGIFMLIIGCSGSSEKVTDKLIETGDYEFTMMDSTGEITASGVLTVSSYTSDKAAGKYKLTKVINTFAGYESMTGNFTGSVNEKEKMILINTNPGYADNNVFFNLNIKKGMLEGEWYYSAFRQVSKSCKIKLVKK